MCMVHGLSGFFICLRVLCAFDSHIADLANVESVLEGGPT